MPYHLATPHCDNTCHHITTISGDVKGNGDFFIGGMGGQSRHQLGHLNLISILEREGDGIKYDFRSQIWQRILNIDDISQ
jgi:hypothetical protein